MQYLDELPNQPIAPKPIDAGLPFEVAWGSVIGRDHQRLGKNNQDAAWVSQSDRVLVAVVCDGCGSAAHSEVGASLGARWVAQAIVDRLAQPINPIEPADLNEPAFWSAVTGSVLAALDRLVRSLGGDPVATVRDYGLFTVLGVAITADQTALFACGDGAIDLNGEAIALGPFPGNAPPYLAYGLLAPPLTSGSATVADRPLGETWGEGLRLVRSLPTAEVRSLLLASDGWLDAPADQPFLNFPEADRLFANPDQVRRSLAVLNQERNRIDWQRQVVDRQVGVWADDTTVILLRRSRR